ncbi:hypothetical protein D9757_000218 [Collybiopsis confluens]|uniref:IMD domain-containing protein n=1 Tax=Collybiopsis confluens TaxID=2823264 RepID=A0A8H5I206_9AGAR|nr:hypothetical protein D9757_000218 [Collybiopsis confluens]
MTTTTVSRSLRERAISFGRRNSSPPGPRSPSPTFSETTNVSAMNFGATGPSKIITRADLRASLQAYERLLSSCASYRAALVALSQATAEFADAMQTTSGLKGPSYEAGTRLQASSGLHHLIGNHYHVLASLLSFGYTIPYSYKLQSQADSLDNNFEKPLRQHLGNYRTIVMERSAAYERALKEKSEIIRQTERRNMNRKERNLQTFRDALAILQRQVDELDELKIEHYAEIVEHEEEVWDVVQAKVCLVVRSTMDVYDKFTSKASDPIIEPMLQTIPDPFDSYGPPQSEDQIFSILRPLSIMPSAPSSSTTSLTQTPEMDNIQGLPSVSSSVSASWTQNTNMNLINPAPVVFPTEPSEWADIPSSPTSTSASTPASPRSTSPASPVIRRHSVPFLPAGHNSRKSDSKLRTVLSVIDESNQNTNSNVSQNRTGVSEQPTPSDTVDSKAVSNDSLASQPLIQPRPQKRPNFTWTSPFSSYSYGYGHSPYNEADTNGDTTPRNSTFIHSSSSEPLSPTNTTNTVDGPARGDSAIDLDRDTSALEENVPVLF